MLAVPLNGLTRPGEQARFGGPAGARHLAAMPRVNANDGALRRAALICFGEVW